jgi:sugar-specific transcriptional regulator TrmB
MAHKTFISYKYSEAQNLRDAIIKALGEDAQYYKGETSDSPDLTDTTTENIKKNLKDMIWETSVTIVIVSPNMIKSKWIDWEIEYSLKEITRSDKTSRTNGIVGVVMKYNGSYSWLKTKTTKPDGHTSTIIDDSKLYPIIENNRYNQDPKQYFCEQCETIDALTGSYISLIDEDDFLSDPEKYIENSFEKSQNISGYKITKTK